MLSKKRILKISVCIIFLLNITTNAQDSLNTFGKNIIQNSNYSKPLISEIHSTLNKIEIGYNKSYSEFDLLEDKSSFERPMVELHLGFEAPLYAQGYGSNQSEKKWGFGIRLPVSIHVLEDMWGPETAPVINTDYRFGGPRLVFATKINNNKYVKNLTFSWLTLFHECTHLGDEIVIYRKDENFPITRINISYEYTEFQFTINDPELCENNCHSLRLGGLYRVSNRGYGWFSIREDKDATADINLSESNIRTEFYAQYQLTRNSGFAANKHCVNIISFEIRDRLRYGYPLFKKVDDEWQTKEVKERMMLNYNLYVGYKFYPSLQSKQNIGLFLHAYRGLNPYGQLRNYPDYPFFGLAINYEPN